MRGLTRALALVMTLVFALSTLHVHTSAAAGHDATVLAGIDNASAPSDTAPDRGGADLAVDCQICSTLSHVLWALPAELLSEAAISVERFSFLNEVGTLWLPPEHHRPPITEAV